jgi:secreted trypsin-like serine protease
MSKVFVFLLAIVTLINAAICGQALFNANQAGLLETLKSKLTSVVKRDLFFNQNRHQQNQLFNQGPQQPQFNPFFKSNFNNYNGAPIGMGNGAPIGSRFSPGPPPPLHQQHQQFDLPQSQYYNSLFDSIFSNKNFQRNEPLPPFAPQQQYQPPVVQSQPQNVRKQPAYRVSAGVKDEQQCGILKPKVVSFIANGRNAQKLNWPWHVQITIAGNNRSESETFCGGTLISKRYVLTAAHCYDDLLKTKHARNTIMSFVGLENKRSKNSAVRLRAQNVYIHHMYVPAMSEYEARMKGVTPGPFHDLALIELALQDQPVEILDQLVPICLPSDSYDMNLGTTCKIMGHGFMNSDDEDNFVMPTNLQIADVSVESNQVCKDEVESQSIKSKINEGSICIKGPIHPCVGDSGGPLLCTGKSSSEIFGHMTDEESDEDVSAASQVAGKNKKWYLMGVTSFAVSTDDNDRCGHFKSAVFAKVSRYIQWINSIVN